MKNVLIITYYWPPAGGPGIQRILKFVKYLPEFGWNPIVMTVQNGEYPAIDYNLEKEIPKGIKIYKFPIWEPHKFYKKLTGIKKDEPIPVAVLADKENISIIKRITNSIRANLFLPDARIGWYFTAVREGLKIINDENINCIFVSSPPHSLQLIGKKLKEKTSLPLISDMRDPWTKIFYYHNIKRWKLAKKVDASLEHKILSYSDLILTVSPAIKSSFEFTCKDVNCKVLYNGYDQTDFVNLSKLLNTKKFTIAYTGNLSATQNPESLWKVLNKLVDENKRFRDNFMLELTGYINSDVINSISQYNLKEFTTINNYLPHHEAIQKMISASSLLFIIPETDDNEGILTGKLFDYLASGTPILSIGPEKGDAAKILNQTKAGKMIDYKNENKIEERIIRLFEGWERNSLNEFSPNSEIVKQYERRYLTSVLANFLTDIRIK